MKLVPVFYLRKPWYILLKYTPDEIKKSTEWRKALTGIGNNIIDSIISLHEPDKLKLSSDEIAFIQDVGVVYDSIYLIRSKAIGKLCSSLPSRWYDIGKSDKNYGDKIIEAYRKAFRGKGSQNRSSVQEKINGPLSKIEVPLKNGVTIYDTMATYFCLIAKYACRDNKDELAEIDRILEYIQKIPSIVDKTKPEELDKRVIDKHDRFWRQGDDNDIPIRFSESHWACYERTDANYIGKSSWGIAKSYLYIGKQNNRGYTSIKFKSRYNEKSYESTGVVTYDVDSECLVAQLIRQSELKDNTPETPIFFVMTVRDADNQSLLVGHYINYSIYFEKFITKTVIWTETDEEFTPKDLINLDKDFNKIDISIRRYLYSRSQNRLTQPHRGFANLKNPNDKDRSLSVWLESRIGAVYRDKKLLACVDKYYVCYFYGDAINPQKLSERSTLTGIADREAINDYIAKFLRVDELQITYDENAVAFAASYIHYTHESKSGVKKLLVPTFYEGKVVRKNLTIQVFTEHKKYKSSLHKTKTTSGNYILVNFKLPLCNEDEAYHVYNEHDYFEGIVSGISDSENDPLSFRALIVKQQYNRSKRKSIVQLNFADRDRNDISKKIISYFKLHINQYQIKI